MRIAFLTHQWPGVRLGGIGVYTLNAARLLASAGHEAHVFTLTLPEDIRAAIPAGVIVHEVADLAQRSADGTVPGMLAAAVHAGGEAVYRLGLGALLCDRVRHVHGQTPFDVIEAPEYEALGLPLVMSAIPGLPMITHIHSGSAVVRLGTHLDATPEQLSLEALECAAILGADALCAPTRHVIADTLKACPFGKADVLPLPFFDDFHTAYSDPPPPLDAPILFIGRLETAKGAHLLPAAFNIFLEQHPAARIRLAGPDTATAPPPDGGSMAQWMRARIAAEYLHRVIFLGEQTKAQLAAELRNASFVIVPSLFESYSYVCCEAMAAGRGIIVSHGIGAADVVGDAGVTFRRGDSADLAEKMHLLFEDREWQLRLAATAYQRIRTVLGPAATLTVRAAFYERVMEEARRKDRRSLQERLANLPARYSGPLVQVLTRISTVLCGVPDPVLKTPGTRLAGIMRHIAAQSGKAARVVLYGAGRHSSRLLAEKHLWEKDGHQVAGFIDDHARFRVPGARHLGLPVESLAEFMSGLEGKDLGLSVVLSTDTFQEQFWMQTAAFREAGVGVFRLYE